MTFSERDRKAGAGCLVAAGLLGFLPALLLGWWFGLTVWSNGRSALNAIQWSSVAAFVNSWWLLIRYGSDSENLSALFLLIIAGYLALLWQWIAFVSGLRTIFSERRLWAVSSGYFLGVMLFVAYAGYQEFKRLETNNVRYDKGAALTWGGLVCLIPVAFLSITFPLWLSTPKPRSEPTDTRSRSK